MELVKPADGPTLVPSAVEKEEKEIKKDVPKRLQQGKDGSSGSSLPPLFHVFLRFISGRGSVPWKCALAGSETP